MSECLKTSRVDPPVKHWENGDSGVSLLRRYSVGIASVDFEWNPHETQFVNTAYGDHRLNAAARKNLGDIAL